MLPCRPQEHHIIDRDIRDLSFRRDLAGVGEDVGFFYMIVFVLHKGVQRAVDGVVLAGLDLNRDGGQAVVIIDQEIDLAFVAVFVTLSHFSAALTLGKTHISIYILLRKSHKSIARAKENRLESLRFKPISGKGL